MMKRKVITFLLLLISIFVFLFSNYSTSASTGKTIFYKDSENGIIAYKQINAFQLQLSDGRVLSSMSLTTNSDVTVEENYKNVDIVFVLDNSGSMDHKSGHKTRISVLQSSAQTLIDNLSSQIKSNLGLGVIRIFRWSKNAT